MNQRPLSEAEITLARQVFGDAIDYGRVAVHARGFLPFGLQHPATSMAPNGGLYCGERVYRPDFACGDARDALHFIHEMTHVWQHQLGYPVWLAGLLIALRGGYLGNRAYRYDARLAQGRALAGFNMEQQADLVAHWAGAAVLGLADYAPRRPALELALGGFLRSASDPALLPARLW
jgi:hypothetical protein